MKRNSPLLASLLLMAASTLPQLSAQVDLKQEGDVIHVQIDGKPFTDFIMKSPDAWRPYLHPLRSASGKIVTRRYPMEKTGDEPTDHPHHRGVFFGHQDVNKINFWASEPVYANQRNVGVLGKIQLKEVNQVKSGKRSGSVTATFDWVGPDNKLVLTEKRTMAFYADKDLRTIDFDFLLIPNGKIVFGDEKDGLFAVRVHKGLQEEKSNGKMTNDQGATTEKNVWGKPSKWVDFAGEVEGEKLGLALFDHPENIRHPQRWHARGYGLFSVNPFCLSAFLNDKSKNGEYVLDEKSTLRLRYRLVIHPGDTETGGVAGLYEKYAKKK